MVAWGWMGVAGGRGAATGVVVEVVVVAADAAVVPVATSASVHE